MPEECRHCFRQSEGTADICTPKWLSARLTILTYKGSCALQHTFTRVHLQCVRCCQARETLVICPNTSVRYRAATFLWQHRSTWQSPPDQNAANVSSKKMHDQRFGTLTKAELFRVVLPCLHDTTQVCSRITEPLIALQVGLEGQFKTVTQRSMQLELQTSSHS